MPLSSKKSWGFDSGFKLMRVYGTPSDVFVLWMVLDVGAMSARLRLWNPNTLSLLLVSVDSTQEKLLTLICPTHHHHWLLSELPLLDLEAQDQTVEAGGESQMGPGSRRLGPSKQSEGRFDCTEVATTDGMCQQPGSQRHHAAMHQRSTYRSHPTTATTTTTTAPTTHPRAHPASPSRVSPNRGSRSRIEPTKWRERERTPRANQQRGGVRKSQASNDESGMETHLTPTCPPTHSSMHPGGASSFVHRKLTDGNKRIPAS